MRGLSPLELRGLTSMVANPEYVAVDDDPIEDAWNACVERGLASYQDDGEWQIWSINSFGRLALRVHQAVNQ